MPNFTTLIGKQRRSKDMKQNSLQRGLLTIPKDDTGSKSNFDPKRPIKWSNRGISVGSLTDFKNDTTIYYPN